MPENGAYILEEAALRFSRRLLLCARVRKLSLSAFCASINVSRVTLYRWRQKRRIPVSQVVKISSILNIDPACELLGTPLNGPKDLWEASNHPSALAGESEQVRCRQLTGFGVAWLASRISPENYTITTEMSRGDQTNPTARLLIATLKGKTLAHVDLAVMAGRFLYQAFRYPPLGNARKIFEGCADPDGLEMCLEFLKSFEDKPRRADAGNFEQNLKKTIHTNFLKHVTSFPLR